MKAVPKDFTDSCIGNRLTSASPVLGDHTYTPNSLNQYAAIATNDSRTAAGRAPVDWTVLVNGASASRIGEIFHRPLTAANATTPVWQNVVIQRDTGTPSMTQHFWYAPQSFTPTYDDDGNLTNDGRWTYLWDAEQCDRIGSILDGGEAGARRVHLPMPRQMNQHRLIQMENTTQATTATHPYTKLQFVYDWQGRRIARHVWQGGTQASPTFKSSHRWLYDGWNVITEFSAPSATSTTLTRLNTFTWGLDLSGTLQGAGGVGGLLVQTSFTDSNIGIQRASYDGNGNIVAWTKSNASAPTSRREYDAFGNTLVSEGTTPSTFGFSSKMQDVETGLYYYGYRYYDPVTGRWPSRDPIEEEGGINLYAFVVNDGVNDWEYLGQKGGGHHIVPWHLFNKKVSEVVQRFFDSDAARIFNEYYKTHNAKSLNGISHRKYNKLLKDALREFLGEAPIRKMTIEQAEKFLNQIKSASASSPMGQFNSGVAQEAADAMKNALKQAAKEAAEKSLKSAKNAGAKIVKGSSKRAGAAGVVITFFFFAQGQDAQGLGNQYLDEMADAADMYSANPLGGFGILGGSSTGDAFRLLKKSLNNSFPEEMGASVCDMASKMEFKSE